MTEVAGTLFKHRERLNEMGTVLARRALAAWAARGDGSRSPGPVDAVVHRVRKLRDMEASTGDRLLDAVTELRIDVSASVP